MSIGYACLTIGVPDTGLSSCTLKNATPNRLRRLIASNLSSLDQMIEYNKKNRIGLFRISSDIIPFGSHPVNTLDWKKEFANELSLLGNKIKESGIRVSMHPGQYTVLNSPNPEVVARAVEDLLYHAGFLDALQADDTCKIILHVGGVYHNKAQAMERFIKQYQMLPYEIKKRLIIENDEDNYNISEVLTLSGLTGAPVVFDNLHHKLHLPIEEAPEEEWIRRCADTWSPKDGVQKIHYSQQRPMASAGSHSETILLSEFAEFYEKLPDRKPDIMLEVKDKNLSAVKCSMGVLRNASAVELEAEWARYKYYVLSKSAPAYQAIRELLKNKKERVAREFYDIIEQASLLSENKGAEINAAQHVWGYLSKDAKEAEKRRYQKLQTEYEQGLSSIDPMKRFLLKAARERNQEYLLQSLYFYIC